MTMPQGFPFPIPGMGQGTVPGAVPGAPAGMMPGVPVSVSAVSLNPADMVEGGALPSDRVLLVQSAHFDVWDYQGKGNPAVGAWLKLMDPSTGETFEQFYSAGDPQRFIPTQDKMGLLPIGDAKGLSKSSNFYQLMSAAVNSGFPADRIGTNIGSMAGMVAFWQAIPQPERKGLKREEGQKGRVAMILVPTQIYKLPWEQQMSQTPRVQAPAAAAPVSAVAPAPAPAPAPAGDSVSTAAVKLVADALSTSASVTRQQLAGMAFQKLGTDPNRDAITMKLFAPDFPMVLAQFGFKAQGDVISK